MNIALQFSGQLRDFKQCYNFFKIQLLDNIDIDIYLSTWKLNVAQLFNDDGDLSDFINMYIVKNYRTDNLDTNSPLAKRLKYLIDLCPKHNVYGGTKYDYMIYGFYQRYKCNQLRQRYGINYDKIIVTRPDLVLGEPFTRDILEYNGDELLIPAGSDWVYGTNDLMVIGSPRHIDTYCNLFQYLEEYILSGVLLHPEHLLKYHLDEHSVPVKRFSYVTHLRARKMT